MARNDGLDALIGLGILGTMLGDESRSTVDAYRERMTASGKTSTLNKKSVPADGAKAAKEIYDSYVAVGFSESQAFELLKTVLTTKRTIF